MNNKRRVFGTILLLIAVTLGACGQQASVPTPAQPTTAPTEGVPPADAPTEGAPTDTTEPAAPTEQPVAPTDTPRPVGPGPSIQAISPINATIPESVKGAGEQQNPDTTFANFVPKEVKSDAVFAPVPFGMVAPDLGNVELNVLLAPEQRERLADIHFVVSPGDTKEFYEVYERARYDYVPVFVTSDSLLHVYHLLFDKTLRRTEMDYFIPMLSRLDWEMLNTTAAQYEALNGTPWGEAARRNAAYFAVAVKILNPDWAIPQGLEDLVEPDLASIAAHNSISPSAIFPAYPEGEDWSQYVPRGHYTKNEELKRYFVAMMWHGRMTFRATDSIETQQAALLTLALEQTDVVGMPARSLWKSIYEPTVFFVGRSDDLTPMEYEQALESAYGRINDVTDLLDDTKFTAFQQATKELRPPQILGMVISRDEPDVEGTTQGLRFMGQRFVPDAFVFGKLIDRQVPDRPLPKALDFFAVLGSDRALDHLEKMGETEYENYPENMEELRTTFASYDEQTWTQNLYWTWIYSLLPLLEPNREHCYPEFICSDAWMDKQLTTALGSWTELKRDTILYAKQVYAERGAGAIPPPTPEPPKGYVEPVPEVYARVSALSQMTIDGLEQRGLLNENDKAALDAMVKIADRLQTIAAKELSGDPISDEEYEFIRFYGAEIEALTFAAGDDEGTYYGRGGTPSGGDPLQAAVIADVATNPNGVVLEEGVGRVFDIYVIVPINNRYILTKGGVFSHYEFEQPLSDRLTDEAWREMLDRGEAPPLAEWTSSYLVEQKAEDELADTIREFNTRLVEAFWFTDPEMVAPFLGETELADTRSYIEDELVAKGEFLGMKRYSLSFLSFDFQDADHAVVTTRENWLEEFYTGEPYYGEQEPQKVRERGPYTTTVTYTMERRGEGWIITKIVTQGEEMG